MTNTKTVSWQTITPAMAEKYLKEMVAYIPLTEMENRKDRQANIDYFANALRNGVAQETHQGIAFNQDNQMVDGQNRMWAILETGIPMTVQVTHGLNKAEVLAIDQGRFRDAKDNAHYAGISADPLTWSILQMMVNGARVSSVRLPPSFAHGWYGFYREALDFTIGATATCRPGNKRLRAPAMSAIARAYYAVPTEALLRFIEVLKTGQRRYEADSAAVLLRDGILAGTLGDRADIYFKTLAAIRAFNERRAIKKLQAAETDIWSIPALPKELRYNAKRGAASPRTGEAARKRLKALWRAA